VGYSKEQLDRLIDHAYQITVEPGEWPRFLKALATTIDGVFPMLFVHDPRTHTGQLDLTVDLDEDLVRNYKAYYAERNVWLRGAARLLTPGQIRFSHRMCSRRTFLGSEWYSDFCRPLGISNAIGATILREGSSSSNIAVFAGIGRPLFDQAESELFAALLPHLRRALTMYQHVAKTTVRYQNLIEVLDCLSIAVLLVGASGKVMFLNRAAGQLIASGDVLVLDAAGLRTTCASCTAKLRRLIAQVAQTTARQGLDSGGSLRVPRAHPCSPLDIVVGPIRGHDAPPLVERAVAMIYVTDPGQRLGVPQAFLTRLYGLTPTEGTVAALIGKGLSAKEAAQQLGVSYNTLKTHLKRVFAKTHTRRQSELVGLIARTVVLAQPAADSEISSRPH
jgi:DNA-binding CsgD family transcriptional regulator